MSRSTRLRALAAGSFADAGPFAAAASLAAAASFAAVAVTVSAATFAAVAASAAFAAPVDAQPTTFLKIEGVAGESVDRDHRGWIEITSVQWPTGEMPKVGPGVLRVSKHYDMGSPYLKQACFQNTVLPEVVLSMRARDGDSQRVVLRNVRLSDCQPGTREAPTETMSLNFAAIRVEEPPRSTMKIDGFLKVPDIPGESKDRRFPGWLELEQVDMGGPAARGQRRIRIVKPVDRASRALAAAHTRGAPFAQVTLAVRRDAAAPDYMQYELKNVQVTSYQRNDVGMEEVVLTVEAVEPR